jgi:chemotaxis protein CheY-P-specific phosphatase CheC
MSKGGGAGKVYFVLYLAVVLELLIIIVERDEAEEHLHQKQKEAMKIVQSILSQLQSGSGTEGINTRPQDEITIPPPGVNIKEVLGIDIKSERRYIVEVGVTDVSANSSRMEGEAQKEYMERLEKLVRLANVEDLEYQVFYNSSLETGAVPPFPSNDYFREKSIDFTTFDLGKAIIDPETNVAWEFVGIQKIKMDAEATFKKLDLANISKDLMHPIYDKANKLVRGPTFGPNGFPEDSIFHYSIPETKLASGIFGDRGTLSKRAFVVNFQPPGKAGWYKLRFVSKTNRILGVRSDQKVEELDKEATVNIGTVQLKVTDLMKVEKELQRKLEKYEVPAAEVLTSSGGFRAFDEAIEKAKNKASKEEDAGDLIGNIRLYGYIVKLLTPGQSQNFEQNKGDIEFNIRVMTPKPKMADPVVNVSDNFYRFNEGKINFRMSISPYQGDANVIRGTVHDAASGTSSQPVANITFKRVSEGATTNGGNADYIATIDKELSAGANGGPRTYKIKLTHQLQGKSETKEPSLFVFPAKVEEKIRNLQAKLNALSVYGEQLFFNFEPPSGNKIAPEQFGYYFKTDADPQDRGLVNGLSAERADNLYFSADMKKASLRIVWTDPISKEEIDIFPKYEFKIAQSEPGIATINQQISQSVDGDMVRVRVSGINVTAPKIGKEGSSQEAEVSITLDAPQVRVPGFSVVGKPTIVLKGGQAQIDFTLRGEPDDDGNIRGTVVIRGSAVAINPINGVQSNPRPINISVGIKTKADKGNDNYYDFEN